MTKCYKVSSNVVLIVTEDRGYVVATMFNMDTGHGEDIQLPSTRVNYIISHCPEISKK